MIRCQTQLAQLSEEFLPSGMPLTLFPVAAHWLLLLLLLASPALLHAAMPRHRHRCRLLVCSRVP
jgi:hypothetical protein